MNIRTQKSEKAPKTSEEKTSHGILDSPYTGKGGADEKKNGSWPGCKLPNAGAGEPGINEGQPKPVGSPALKIVRAPMIFKAAMSGKEQLAPGL
jgi:hypothetical protein